MALFGGCGRCLRRCIEATFTDDVGRRRVPTGRCPCSPVVRARRLAAGLIYRGPAEPVQTLREDLRQSEVCVVPAIATPAVSTTSKGRRAGRKKDPLRYVMGDLTCLSHATVDISAACARVTPHSNRHGSDRSGGLRSAADNPGGASSSDVRRFRSTGPPQRFWSRSPPNRRSTEARAARVRAGPASCSPRTGPTTWCRAPW